MPRPQTKNDLILAANGGYAKLWSMIDSMTPDARSAAFCFLVTEKDKEAHWRRDQNLRDVLVHLYEWHQLLLRWVSVNQKGEEIAPFLPVPYNWKNYGEMNVQLWKKHQNTSLDDAVAMLQQSHKKVLALAEGFTNEELFTKAHFTWSGTNAIGSYFVSATSSHYDWAMKKIKRQQKALRTGEADAI